MSRSSILRTIAPEDEHTVTPVLFSQFPAFIPEIMHRFVKFIQWVFFSNNLENDVTYSTCRVDGIA